MRCNVSLDEIKIPQHFDSPKEKKMEQCREYFKKNGRLDRKIIVNEDMVLIDGYVGYLVLKENNIDSACITKNEGRKCILIYGRHIQNPRAEYCWKVVPETENVENMKIDGLAIVRTCFGDQEIRITKIEERKLGTKEKVRHKRVVKFL